MKPDVWITVPAPITVQFDDGVILTSFQDTLSVLLVDRVFGGGIDASRVAELIFKMFQAKAPGEHVQVGGSHHAMLMQAIKRPDPPWRNVYQMRKCIAHLEAIEHASVEKPKEPEKAGGTALPTPPNN